MYSSDLPTYKIISMKPMKLVIELYIQYADKKIDLIDGSTPVDQNETILSNQNTTTQETGSRAVQNELIFTLSISCRPKW